MYVCQCVRVFLGFWAFVCSNVFSCTSEWRSEDAPDPPKAVLCCAIGQGFLPEPMVQVSGFIQSRSLSLSVLMGVGATVLWGTATDVGV